MELEFHLNIFEELEFNNSSSNFFFFFNFQFAITQLSKNRISKQEHFPKQFQTMGILLESFGKRDKCPFWPIFISTSEAYKLKIHSLTFPLQKKRKKKRILWNLALQGMTAQIVFPSVHKFIGLGLIEPLCAQTLVCLLRPKALNLSCFVYLSYCYHMVEYYTILVGTNSLTGVAHNK